MFPGIILKFLKESGYTLDNFKSNFYKTDIRLSLNKFQMKSLGLMLKIQ